jgi:serine/threonine protein kinase
MYIIDENFGIIGYGSEAGVYVRGTSATKVSPGRISFGKTVIRQTREGKIHPDGTGTVLNRLATLNKDGRLKLPKGVLKVRSLFEDRSSGPVARTTSFLKKAKSDLGKVIRGAPYVSNANYKSILDLFYPLFTAIEAFHEKELVHRDIKPDNIFYTAEPATPTNPLGAHRLYLGDFGTVADSENASLAGTAEYLPPKWDWIGTKKADVYALAISLGEVITGKYFMEYTGEVLGASSEYRNISSDPIQQNAWLERANHTIQNAWHDFDEHADHIQQNAWHEYIYLLQSKPSFRTAINNFVKDVERITGSKELGSLLRDMVGITDANANGTIKQKTIITIKEAIARLTEIVPGLKERRADELTAKEAERTAHATAVEEARYEPNSPFNGLVPNDDLIPHVIADRRTDANRIDSDPTGNRIFFYLKKPVLSMIE